ncbi:hypothetical protein ET445_00615 [Agromyces protaetiae]|uniref:Uncharacterized protein n=1 Tax=Agromyces protaetiae TaxID=2509455 RepID=A0A4P6F8H9_9MICO|nr:hypothetical protein [Agromyces protaetiae]QAY72054.1 hypothetical protein ET445_00615 [Agromyces protaetiae]
MTDFVDPLEEPFAYDRDPRAARDFAEQDAEAALIDREHRAEEAASGVDELTLEEQDEEDLLPDE